MSHGRIRQEWNYTSSLLAMIANANRDHKKRSRPFEAGEFHPFEKGKRRSAGMPVKAADIGLLKELFVTKKGEGK